MKLQEAGERKIIEKIKSIVRRKKGMIADFDDDAAIFTLKEGNYAVTTDMGLMSTHFLTENPEKIGRKIVTANVTDLLCKGAIPEYMLVSIGLQRHVELEFVERMYIAMDKELKKYGAYIIGGDTNKAEEFVYSITMIGGVIKPLLRAGAKEGDYVVVTGQIGNASAGYITLKNNLKGEKAFIDAQLEPKIDFKLCRKLIPQANAGVDISDGLGHELGEVARLSKKKIVLDWNSLPMHPKLPEFCEKNGLNIMDILFHHGEDYQVVYTTPNPAGGHVIGRVSEGSGVFLLKDGKEQKIEPRGYEHFRSN